MAYQKNSHLTSIPSDGVLILDFGSQYTWLIARSLRELGFYSQVESFDLPLENIIKMKPAGIILSGGPASVLSSDSPTRDLKALLEIAPLMGVCYGFQLICHQWGGKVVPSSDPDLKKTLKRRTYGRSYIDWKKPLLYRTGQEIALSRDSFPFGEKEKQSKSSNQVNREEVRRQKVWMSHGDFVSEVPKGFSILAETKRKVPAVLKTKNILALQFHPEVSHTEQGKDFLSYFVETMCGVKKGNWTADSMLSLLESQIKEQLKPEAFVDVFPPELSFPPSLSFPRKRESSSVNGKPLWRLSVPRKRESSPPEGFVGASFPENAEVLSSNKILCALSGGVDSTVMACLLTKALGPDRIHCVFVDTGLLRENEFQEVLDIYKKLKLNVKGIFAERKFLKALEGVTDPEKKRKTIGRVFIEIFEEYKKKHSDIKYLAQGTLYPDVIESLSFKGPSATIKSHHNVGGLPKNLPFKLVEPLRFLFKDEVRVLGEKLQIPKEFLQRHPFPGPGLAVRVCGEITKKRLQKLKKADAIFIKQLRQAGLYEKIWQAFAVLLPVKSVGVQGDERTYDEVIVLRAITSRDGMTADWFSFPSDFLHKVSDHITNEVQGINRVVYDITSKPPGTIEWL
ncbi:MAG: glutamine-hydrolyzing GMP synthase [Bdellovibrionales bacterium]|nr:glutamine-hydrolyzing GMP synthase [Bdellovibrionales bacterium]